MLLWRAMSLQELCAFQRGEIIKPKNDVTKQVNSWEEPVLCFFGTCNNALHWASPIYGHQCVVGFEVSPLAVTAGWGRYPNLSMLDEKEIGRVFVKEYAVKAYSKAIAKCVKQICFDQVWFVKDYKGIAKAANVDVYDSYDDLCDSKTSLDILQKLTQEQKDIYHEFAVTFAERWKDYDGKDEHNGKCMQSKK